MPDIHLINLRQLLNFWTISAQQNISCVWPENLHNKNLVFVTASELGFNNYIHKKQLCKL